MVSSSPLKLMHLIHSLEMGGAQRVIANLVKHHDRSKYTPVVGSLRRAGALEGSMREAGADVVYFDKQSAWDIGCALRLRSYIREHRIDLVNAHNFSASFWGRIACAGLGDVKFVMTEHGRIEPPTPKVVIFNRLFASGVDAIIAVGEETAAFTKATYPYIAHKVNVVVNGIDIPDKPGWTRERLASEFGIQPDAPVIANMAALTPVKDQALLIRAFNLLRNDLPNAQLLIIGDGPLRGELETLRDELGLADCVVFTGERLDGPEIMAACDVFCLSSRLEGTPMSVLEAMAHNRPLVLTAVGGIPNLIRDGEEGLLAPHGDPEALSGALRRILNDGELGERLAGNALRKLRANHSADAMTRNTEEVYGKLTQS